MILEPKKIIPLLGIQHGMTVLDIGSSVGFWVKPISHIVGNSGKVVAVDSHAEIIQRLNHDVTELGMTNVHAITGDIHNLSELSLRDHSYDRVLCIRMISVIEDDIQNKVKQLLDFIKDDGKLIIIDAMHYRALLLSALRVHSAHMEFTEMPEVAERTDNYFFGIVISAVRD